MKSWRAAAVLLLCLALVGSTACSPFGDGSQEETSQQLVEVVRGDLIVSVSGSGDIDVSNEANLVFGTGGRIDRIFIDEGDEVAEGEVLAGLDTAPLELAVTQAQAALAQAQIARTQTQIAQAQAQADFTQAQAALAQAEAARTQVQIVFNLAEDDLEDAYDFLRWSRRTFDTMDAALEEAEVLYETAELEFEVAETQLAAAELQIEATGLQLEIAESQLELVEPQLEAADLQLEAAEQALEEAQRQLDMVTITAPFDGAVVSVDVNEGDTVSAATPTVYLIDLSSIELKAGIDEIDIPSVKLNQRAVISLDALPDLQLEGEVSSISLMPTVQAGLVIYDVTISFDVAEDSDLRVGMSATVDIIINERSNVLLVPDRAIKQDSQGNPVVMVMVGEQTRERPIVIGISDGFETEIVSGLDEGETVVIELRTKTSSSGSGGFLFGE